MSAFGGKADIGGPKLLPYKLTVDPILQPSNPCCNCTVT